MSSVQKRKHNLFGEQQYIVIDDYGPCGKVAEYFQGGDVIDNFYWETQEERAILVSRGRASYIKTINLLVLLSVLTIFIWFIVLVTQVF